MGRATAGQPGHDAVARAGRDHGPVTRDRVEDVRLTSDGRIDGRPPAFVRRTHCAELWFTPERVYKRKRPVDLGFLDFSTLDARRSACRREVELNSRLAPDVYLGLADVCDPDGRVSDIAVVMRRLPDDRRLSTLLGHGAQVDRCVRAVARQVAAFHAAQPPAADGPRYASVAALRTNWDDNLDVLRAHPDLVEARAVSAVDADVTGYLDGRGPLIEARLAGGSVRDGHGDLQAGDIFCLDDGPRVLDCLEFADRYRIGDVLLDAAFLAMDLERLGRPDLARGFLSAYQEFTGARHPASLVEHFIAYRAGVRAKVACLSAAADQTGECAGALLDIARRHLARGRVRMVLVGGAPGTGKSTLAAGLSDRRGWTLLRSDEVRKDLLGVPHDRPAGPAAYRPPVVARTYRALLDRAERLLVMGESVILDATWADASQRRAALDVARRTSSAVTQLRCTVPAGVARRRLAGRVGDASDATPPVHDTVAGRFAPWVEATVIDATAPPAAVVDAALHAVDDTPGAAVVAGR